MGAVHGDDEEDDEEDAGRGLFDVVEWWCRCDSSSSLLFMFLFVRMVASDWCLVVVSTL